MQVGEGWPVLEFDRLGESGDEARRQRACRGDRDLLPEDGPHREFEAIEGPGQAQAARSLREPAERRADFPRVGVHIEDPFDLAQHSSDHRRKGGRQRHLQRIPVRLVGHLQPAADGLRIAASNVTQDATIAAVADGLDARDGALLKKGEQRRPVKRGAIRQAEGEEARVFGDGCARSARLGQGVAQARRSKSIALRKQRIHTANTGKTAGESHLGDRQGRIGQQVSVSKRLASSRRCVCAYCTGDTPNSV
ncbi:MAG: hypothetical protein AW10_04049 [Candidatus Accumulibacter appositus]|uniref:Uncharacterized protein n=1 Tax=Candidatus Accumulibacter appositus TaxID=1454003 RepID=A0A011PJ45_9PROT|nr:MAG: hypothetical protein AW10_04049 [Candidatus Accumulibacter appositus]